jgi:SAM-dependent methyltransferase
MARRLESNWVPWAMVGVALVVILALGLAAGSMLQNYDESIGFDEEAGRIAEILELEPGMSVGDVRAGTGKWSVDMSRRIGDGIVYATVGPDPASVIYETVARARVDNVTVIVRTPGDAPRLPLECCDAILLRFVYRAFENRVERIAHNLWLTTKPGGRLAIIDWQAGSPARNAIPKETVIKEVTAQGFELERAIDDWAADVYCLVFRKPESSPSSIADAS